MKRKIRAKLSYPLNVQCPEQLFDLICFKNWLEGNAKRDFPVERSREVYKQIKRLILYYND